MSDSDEARRNREANHPDVLRTEEPAAKAEVAEPEQPKATLGPLGAFFKRRAEFFEQEATMLAIHLERLAQATAAAQSKE